MKKSIVQIIISSVIIFNSTIMLFGQEIIIQGKVTAFDSIPIIDASISVKSSDKVVFSDTLGLFTVSCLPKDKLKVAASGFSNQHVKIDENADWVFVNLNLKPGPENQELAKGHVHVRDRDKFEAITRFDEDEVDFSNYADVYEIIKGRFPGVQVSGDEIIIRGVSSLYMSNSALLVADGIVVGASYFRSIPTIDIASVNVLKGTDASMYGVRGANGVVIVKTKGGRNQ